MSLARLLAETHALARDWWDPSRRLLVHPGGLLGDRVVRRGDVVGLVPSTAWWALGLLERGAAGDRELAEVAVRSVLDRGLGGDEQERREVATALALLLRDHELPATLAGDARAAVARTVHAAAARAVDVTRTDAAVLRAWLELEVGRWEGDEELLASGAARARAVAADAGVRGHVAVHGSPSASGVALLGLSLWAERPPVDDLAPLGRALRDEVWHDLLAAWHPGLRTMVPPFTRARGIDLTTHVAVAGLWFAWLVDGVEPVPPLHEPQLHQAQDLPLVFAIAALADASRDVRDLAPLVRAQPPRQGEWYDRVGERVWTGWTGGDLAVGAEWSPDERGGASQAVTAAAVWRSPTGGNAWLRLHQRSGAVEARVEQEDGVVRLVHGTTTGPVELWLGGGEATVAAERLEHGGRTWWLEGVAEVAPTGRPSPQVTGAWALEARADGIVLTTEV